MKSRFVRVQAIFNLYMFQLNLFQKMRYLQKTATAHFQPVCVELTCSCHGWPNSVVCFCVRYSLLYAPLLDSQFWSRSGDVLHRVDSGACVHFVHCTNRRRFECRVYQRNWPTFDRHWSPSYAFWFTFLQLSCWTINRIELGISVSRIFIWKRT